MSETNLCCSLKKLELAVTTQLLKFWINQSALAMAGWWLLQLPNCHRTTSTSSILLVNLCFSYCTCVSHPKKLAKGHAQHLLDLILMQMHAIFVCCVGHDPEQWRSWIVPRRGKCPPPDILIKKLRVVGIDLMTLTSQEISCLTTRLHE